MIGKVFGKLTVVAECGKRKSAKLYTCRCTCGGERTVYASHLKRGNSKSCGQAGCRSNGARHPAWKGCGQISGNEWNRITRQASGRTSASRRPKLVLISIQQAWDQFELQGGKCALTGLALSFGSSLQHGSRTASLDRIDSNGEYTIDNIQWVHKDVNIMKNRFDQGYFISLCRMIAACDGDKCTI